MRRQKHRSAMLKKIVVMFAAVVLIVAATISGTLAWLTDNTDTVTNTFTVGNIDIDLKETKTDFKMVPGNSIDKDPKVSVKEGSEACWLFIDIDESTNLDAFISYSIAEGWTLLETDKEGKDIKDDLIYYRTVSAEDATNGVEYSILANDKVTVWETVSKSDVDAFDANKDGTIDENESKALPTLSFTAYACQSANVTTAADAWANIQSEITDSAS